MSSLTRFGRKIALPSTRQIRHELLVMMQDEAKLKASQATAVETPAVVAAPAVAVPLT